jgi:hypothetical protein
VLPPTVLCVLQIIPGGNKAPVPVSPLTTFYSSFDEEFFQFMGGPGRYLGGMESEFNRIYPMGSHTLCVEKTAMQVRQVPRCRLLG